jgi:pimeloyl-ACP methyl ester carboxylesterase
LRRSFADFADFRKNFGVPPAHGVTVLRHDMGAAIAAGHAWDIAHLRQVRGLP